MTKDKIIEFGSNMPGGFLIYEAIRNGKITYTNDTFLQILGYDTLEDFLACTGGTFDGTLYPEDLAEVSDIISSQTVAVGAPIAHITCRMLRKNGEIRWMEGYQKLVFQEDGHSVFYLFLADAKSPKLLNSRLAIYEYLQQLQSVFEVVRLVDVSTTTQYALDASGELCGSEHKCFAFWNKEKRCENCISAKVLSTKGQLTKFEFIGNEPYHVTAKYLEFNGRPFVLELASREDDATLFGVYDKEKFANLIKEYNQKLYIDALTGAYNRNYFEEQLENISNTAAISILDLDHFKNINDTYGHQAGDEALKLFADTVKSNIRKEDMLVRLGGDEFVVIFEDIPDEELIARMEQIRIEVSKARLESYPGLHMTLSAGVVSAKDCSNQSIRRADEMLYQAKEHRDCVLFRLEK